MSFSLLITTAFKNTTKKAVYLNVGVRGIERAGALSLRLLFRLLQNYNIYFFILLNCYSSMLDSLDNNLIPK